jgi:putative oxidoreductase
MLDNKFQITELLIRLFTGVLFVFQGYDKIFKIKIPNVINSFMDESQRHHIARPLVVTISYLTSTIEFICGISLILGLFTNYSLYLLGIDLLLVCIAFSLLNPIWDMKHVFPRFILIIILLLIPNEHNKLSLDYIFISK